MSWKRYFFRSRLAGIAARSGRFLRWTVRIFLILLVVDLFYLAATWPDWKGVASGPVPKSSFISGYERQQAEDRSQPRMRWQPVPLSAIPKHVVRAVIVAEDSRFYEHSGFDLLAFKEAMAYNFAEGQFALGASTISQQTVKNLFLSSARNPLRKWHELVLTWGMEQNLEKKRILEIYLNVAEFGHGVYGVQAAARAYWGVDVVQLTAAQAAELAASLPSPARNNPATRTKLFEKRAKRIMGLLARYPGDAAVAVHGEKANTAIPASRVSRPPVHDLSFPKPSI
jgi:monofunctional biosynthetic peptidoglycan transglycosylase